MSYQTWHTYGYGICVDDIETTPAKLLALASLDKRVLSDVREFLDGQFPDGYNDEDLTIEDFDEYEGDWCERGVANVLSQVINEFPVTFADGYEGIHYLLFAPCYPWGMTDKERDLTRNDVDNIFKKYIKVLTDQEIEIDYQCVENGG